MRIYHLCVRWVINSVGILENRIDNAELVSKGIIATRRLAKKQLTWLRKWSNLTRLEVGADYVASTNINLAKISTVIEDLLT